MTEDQWLSSTDPSVMVRFLIGTDYPRVQDLTAFPDCRASDRKLRLAAVACYHRISHLLPDPRARAAMGVAEDFADGLVTTEELQRADTDGLRALSDMEGRWRASRGADREALLPTHAALALACQATRPLAPVAAYYSCSNASWTVAAITNPGAASSDLDFGASEVAEKRVQAELLRDIFGPLPFRPVVVEPAWLVWNDGTVKRLAEAAYEERGPSGALDNSRLAVLADALADSGCADEELLTHLRRPGPRYRGMWGLDLLVGTE